MGWQRSAAQWRSDDGTLGGDYAIGHWVLGLPLSHSLMRHVLVFGGVFVGGEDLTAGSEPAEDSIQSTCQLSSEH